MTRTADRIDPPERSQPAVFLERQSYRRRRIMDAARLLPLFGALLFAVPLLWPVAPAEPNPGQQGISMSGAMIYVFGAWAGLIVTIALFGLGMRFWLRGDSPHGPGQD